MKLVRKGEAGFTLLELLVVVAIIGFLVAVLLPRFGGMSKIAKDKATKDNLVAIDKYMHGMSVSTGSLGVNNPINLVDRNLTDNSTRVAYTPDEVAPLGYMKGSLAPDFVDEYKPCLHKLSQNEVDELKSMGITSVQNWYDLDPAKAHTKYEVTKLANNTEVVMCGAGNEDGTWDAGDFAYIDTAGTDWLKDWRHVYKILVGWGGEKFQPYEHGVLPGTGKISKPWNAKYHQDFVVFALPRLDSTIRNIYNSGVANVAPGYVCVKEFTNFAADGTTPDPEDAAEEKPVDLTMTFHKYGVENQMTLAGTVWPGLEEEYKGEGTRKWVLIDGNASASCGFAKSYYSVSDVITMYGYH